MARLWRNTSGWSGEVSCTRSGHSTVGVGSCGSSRWAWRRSRHRAYSRSVLTATGQPVRHAFVEIWQTDSTGSCIHTRGRQPTGNDGNFQGYGRFLTDVKGQYYFRTIKPIDYTLIGIFRAPHIHVAISKSGHRIFTTQLLVAGHPANARDTLIKRLDRPALQTLLVDFKPLAGSKIGNCRLTSMSSLAEPRRNSKSVSCEEFLSVSRAEFEGAHKTSLRRPQAALLLSSIPFCSSKLRHQPKRKRNIGKAVPLADDFLIHECAIE